MLVEFSVKPKSCLIKDPQHPCTEKISFFWQTPDNTPVCVRTKLKEVLFCQSADSKSRRDFAFKVTSSTQFELIHSLTKEVLAKAQLMVVTEPETNRHSRYRHPWSIF
ncbi:DUF3019 domain-containing protein [Kangiella shandongensis]|uniref:DUF3019 domain-containing protein n=1 Tax=Kangiella shandongensis TaxID=2763258 RepID=UPI001CBF0B4B